MNSKQSTLAKDCRIHAVAGSDAFQDQGRHIRQAVDHLQTLSGRWANAIPTIPATMATLNVLASRSQTEPIPGCAITALPQFGLSLSIPRGMPVTR